MLHLCYTLKESLAKIRLVLYDSSVNKTHRFGLQKIFKQEEQEDEKF